MFSFSHRLVHVSGGEKAAAATVSSLFPSHHKCLLVCARPSHGGKTSNVRVREKRHKLTAEERLSRAIAVQAAGRAVSGEGERFAFISIGWR